MTHITIEHDGMCIQLTIPQIITESEIEDIKQQIIDALK
jgi:hypothetical protein